MATGGKQQQAALAVCSSCDLPVRVVFDVDGNVVQVLAVCSHVQVAATGEIALAAMPVAQAKGNI